MYKITKHPILKINETEKVIFHFNGQQVSGEKGFTIAAALHQAGYAVHSHSLQNRKRSLECGIGKCGACEMLVDGEIKRICITLCDNIKKVEEIPSGYVPDITKYTKSTPLTVYKTQVLIIGAGPAGLAVRELLNQHNVANIVIDSNAQIGGQFNMQTHQFFFFEKEKKYGGLRGFEISKTLAGEDHSGIFLNCTAWDIFEHNRVAIKNFKTQEIFYVDSEYFVVATGAVPFMPTFHNDDLPGVYTAAVIQKMMNIEMTLLGKNVLTVGAGNIGYLTSYQLTQAGANVKAIIEAMPNEGGFPVQANRVRRLGIPVLLSHMILEAIPNKNNDGITGAVVSEALNFKPIPGTEKIIEGIDAINICTGLMSDDNLLIKGKEMFGIHCYGAGDAVRIGEGTSAVLRGKQVAYEILTSIGKRFNYDDFLSISKEYIDSQQHPIKVIEEPFYPAKERLNKPFILIDCLYGFACNPCAFACQYGAITKSSSSTVPNIDFDKCIGCMQCVSLCPGLAIFGYDVEKQLIYLPVEFNIEEDKDAYLVDNNANIIGEGHILKVIRKKNLTHVVRIKADKMLAEEMMKVSGFILKEAQKESLILKPYKDDIDGDIYLCHCDDVKMDEVMAVIGDRKFISVEEVKHTTHLGMGPCRGKRCLTRLRQNLQPLGIQLVGTATPRAPMANQITIGELYPSTVKEKIITNVYNKKLKIVEVKSFVAGGGIGGSSLFRYLAEAGMEPTMINYEFGSSWRNIAGGRPGFSMPELTDIARHNLEIFKDLAAKAHIDFQLINYITFAHDENMYKVLQDSMAWQDGQMLSPNQFKAEVSPYFNENNSKYLAALKTGDCWQATPGKVIEALRQTGIKNGGCVIENCEIIDLEKSGDTYKIIVRTNDKEYVEYHTPVFINALGYKGGDFALKIGINTGLYPVKHQAFITRRLPMLGINSKPLDMLIDRRNYKGFTAVYGQQLRETGQIIGCASPAVEPLETAKNLKVNAKEFAEIVSEIFIDWVPQISAVGFQALWAGYYIEPRMIIDPSKGLFLGLRGQGFMLSQYLSKLYVDKLLNKEVPAYFERLKLEGDGIPEKAFK